MTCGPSSGRYAHPRTRQNQCRPCWPQNTVLSPCENLADLEGARLALARSDQALFDNLQVALDWLGRYFEAGDHTTAALRSALEEMLALDIHPALPDISQSLRRSKSART